MKVFCNGNDLADAVSKVAKAMPIKKDIPILEGIKLQAIDNTLILTATDLNLAIEKKIVADVKISGEIVVPGKLFAEYMRRIDAEEVSLDATDNSNLIISFEDNEAKVALLDKDAFPPFTQVAEDVTFNIVKKEFNELISKVLFSAATDDIKPILKGCAIDIFDSEIIAVASDGYRLALTRKPIEYKGEAKSIIVPARALSEMIKLIESDEDFIKVNIDNKMIMIDMFHTKIVSRLTEGKFIDYNRIIPKEFNTTVVIGRKDLEKGLDRTSIIYRDNSALSLDIKESLFTLTAKSNISIMKENIKIKLDGKDIMIGCNGRFLNECIKNIDDEFICIKSTTPTSPFVIEPVDNNNFLYLILPIRL